MQTVKQPGSFRDPSGHVYTRKGEIFRTINQSYKQNYEHLLKSGLYRYLVESSLLIPHTQVGAELREDLPDAGQVFEVIKPRPIVFISYPYEWSFSQLKDAALATLKIQKAAIEYNMILKDSSVYNIQFDKGKPVLIDTLSFEKYEEGVPWVAYRQFCQHFLAPLALMAHKDLRLGKLFRLFLDGIPLDLASSLLPWHTFLTLSCGVHIHGHAKFQRCFLNSRLNQNHAQKRINRLSLLGLVDSLEAGVNSIKLSPKNKTTWVQYYKDGQSYTAEASAHKKQIVTSLIDGLQPKNVWDIGSNTGLFSRIIGKTGIPVISFDLDPMSVEHNYLEMKKNNESNLLPLVMDINNPSPAMGWNLGERMSLWERGPADTIVALALIHHLVIGNNLSFEQLAVFFHQHCHSAIIEFVPKDDPQAKRLLAARKDIFDKYSQLNFEKEFEMFFFIEGRETVRESKRIIYLLRNKTC